MIGKGEDKRPGRNRRWRGCGNAKNVRALGEERRLNRLRRGRGRQMHRGRGDGRLRRGSLDRLWCRRRRPLHGERGHQGLWTRQQRLGGLRLGGWLWTRGRRRLAHRLLTARRLGGGLWSGRLRGRNRIARMMLCVCLQTHRSQESLDR